MVVDIGFSRLGSRGVYPTLLLNQFNVVCHLLERETLGRHSAMDSFPSRFSWEFSSAFLRAPTTGIIAKVISMAMSFQSGLKKIKIKITRKKGLHLCVDCVLTPVFVNRCVMAWQFKEMQLTVRVHSVLSQHYPFLAPSLLTKRSSIFRSCLARIKPVVGLNCYLSYPSVMLQLCSTSTLSITERKLFYTEIYNIAYFGYAQILDADICQKPK